MSMRKSTMLVAAMLGLVGGGGTSGGIEIELDTEDYWKRRRKQEDNNAKFPSRKKILREKNRRAK